MSFTEFIEGMSRLGLGGIVFAIWYFDNRKITMLESVVKEQVEEKRIMREERQEFVRIVEEHGRITERCTGILERVERKLPA